MKETGEDLPAKGKVGLGLAIGLGEKRAIKDNWGNSSVGCILRNNIVAMSNLLAAHSVGVTQNDLIPLKHS